MLGRGDVLVKTEFMQKNAGSCLEVSEIITNVDEEDKTTVLIQHPGSNYKSKTMLINDSGLYALILSSKLPQAKEFKRWVTSEVLPSIRRNGAYLTDDALARFAEDPDYGIKLLNTLKRERTERLALMKENVTLSLWRIIV